VRVGRRLAAALVAAPHRAADFPEDEEGADQELALVLVRGLVQAAQAELQIEGEHAVALDELAIDGAERRERRRIGDGFLGRATRRHRSRRDRLLPEQGPAGGEEREQRGGCGGAPKETSR